MGDEPPDKPVKVAVGSAEWTNRHTDRTIRPHPGPIIITTGFIQLPFFNPARDRHFSCRYGPGGTGICAFLACFTEAKCAKINGFPRSQWKVGNSTEYPLGLPVFRSDEMHSTTGLTQSCHNAKANGRTQRGSYTMPAKAHIAQGT